MLSGVGAAFHFASPPRPAASLGDSGRGLRMVLKIAREILPGLSIVSRGRVV